MVNIEQKITQLTQANALIDCRPEAQFLQAHYCDAVNIPARDLFACMQMLPSAHQAISLCGDTQSLSIAQFFLKEKGYEIRAIIVWDDELSQVLQQQQRIQSGHSHQRLWQAAPLIDYFVAQKYCAAGEGLDIACGAGRDSVFLALNGWQMTGIDRNPDALQRTQRLAQSQQVSVNTLLLDMESQAADINPFSLYQPHRFDLICVARYLHRPLFPYLRHLLKDGGYLLYQTFMQGSEKFGSPRNPNYLLKPNELAHVFQQDDIIHDQVIHLQDGRPMSAFIARIRH
ncbi:MAG: methyltransferase domain-containing protein [bacterium]